MEPPRPHIRVAYFDDHAAMREILVRALSVEGSFDVVASGGSAAEAIDSALNLLPDLAILDINMPGGGLEAVRQINRACPFVKPVVLSSDDNEHVISSAFTAGAFGYLIKGQPLASVIAALKAIQSGKSQFSAGLAASLTAARGIATPWHLADEFGELALSPREEQILSRFAQGLTVDEIAGSIGLSKGTVGAYLSNILYKLHENARVNEALGALSP